MDANGQASGQASGQIDRCRTLNLTYTAYLRLYRPGLPVLLLPACALSLCSGFCHGQALPAAPEPQPSALYAAQAGTPAELSGEVLSEDGAIVSGAQVVLEGGGQTRQQLSDGLGHFRFTTIAPGAYTLQVNLPGFVPSSQAVDLQGGSTLVLPDIRLAMATVNISVDAISPEQAALEELHNEEHQRLVGILPNFYVSYNWVAPPLTAGQKFRLATHNVLDPGNLALVGVVAGVQQASNAFPGYGQGAAGYGSRYGADLGNLVVGTYMGGAILPALFRQDPRYFFKGTGTKRDRFWYAVTRPFITRGDNGKSQPNFAGVLGDLSAGAISNAYYPASDRQGAKLTLENGFLAIAGDCMNDFVQEFVFPYFTTRAKNKAAKTKP